MNAPAWLVMLLTPAPLMTRPLLKGPPLRIVVCALPVIETWPLMLRPDWVVMLLTPLPLMVIPPLKLPASTMEIAPSPDPTTFPLIGPLPVLLSVWLDPATVLNWTAVPPLPLIWPVLVRLLSPGPLRMTPGPPVPLICPSLAMPPGPVKLMPRTPWMIAPELLVI